LSYESITVANIFLLDMYI